MVLRRRLRGYAALGALALSGCGAFNLGATVRPPPLAELLTEAGYTPLAIPDSKMGPGAVVELASSLRGGDPSVNYVGDFRECGVPPDVLGLVEGAAPPTTFQQVLQTEAGVSVSSGALLGLEGVRVGPQFSAVQSVSLRLEQAGGDAIDRLRLGNWLSEPGNSSRMPRFCREILGRPNLYIVTEAFRISRGRYDLYGADRQTIDLSVPTNPYLSVTGSGAGTRIANGGVEFDRRYYVAVRNVRPVDAGVMGPAFGRSRDPISATAPDRKIDSLLQGAVITPAGPVSPLEGSGSLGDTRVGRRRAPAPVAR